MNCAARTQGSDIGQMGYRAIRTTDDLQERLQQGVTREGNDLDFKGLDSDTRLPYKTSDRGKREFRLDVAAFANLAGGAIICGAAERNHVFSHYETPFDAQG